MTAKNARPPYALFLLTLAAMAGTALGIYSYYLDIGINHTAGVLLVICTTALIWIAALAIAQWRAMWRILRGILLILVLIDIVGTGVAAWFLESQVLMAFMGVALIGWLAHLLFGPGAVGRSRPDPVQRTLA